MNDNVMGTKPVFPLLMSMAVPTMISMLIQSLYNIVDSFWVAKVGTSALTAVSLAFPLQNIILSLAVGFGVGMASFISIALGAKNKESANKAASTGMLFVVIHCILLASIGYLITEPFLSMFTSDSETLMGAISYTHIVILLSFGSLMQIAMEKIFQGLGLMKVTMYFMLSGCITNIILDPILIFGWFGLPAMGVSGAAVATVIGQILGFVLYVIYYIKKDIGIKISPKYIDFDGYLIKRLYGVGIPSTLMLSLPSVLIAVLNAILTAINPIYVAVLGLYFKLQTFIYMPANGIIQGMRPIVGYNYGAKYDDRVRKIIDYSMMSIIAIMALGTLLSLVIPNQILSIFDSNPDMLKYGSTALRIISTGFIISGISIVGSGVFESVGMGGQSLVVSLLRQFIITIPLSFILSRFIGANGVWISFPVSELIAAIVCIILLKKADIYHFKKKITL